MSDWCARCQDPGAGELTEMELYVDSDGGGFGRATLSKQLCDACAAALVTRMREWCGEDRDASRPNWLKKGYP